MLEDTDLGALTELAVKAATAQLLTAERGTAAKAQFILAPEGMEAIDVKAIVDAYLPNPERMRGTSVHTDLGSFIAMTKRFQDEDSVLFAKQDPTSPTLTAIFNYNAPAEKKAATDAAAAVDQPAQPRWGDHRARYDFPVSDEWRAWIASNKKVMDQATFASFLEDRIMEIADPVNALESARGIVDKLLCKFAGPSTLVDLARGLSVRVESIVANQQNLSSGESVIRFETTHKDDKGAALDIPGAFLVSIPVFRGDAAYQLAARLRYRVKEGRVTWWYDLFRTQETFDDAFKQACAKATTETELSLFFGTSEGG